VPPQEPPPALVIIDPKTPGETYPFAHLSATAVVAKLVWALRFAATPLYNQRLCLLNAYRDETGLVVEACRIVNLVETKRFRWVYDEKSTSNDLTLLVSFLQDQEIYVFDERAQLKLLRQLFGAGVEIGLFDLAPGIVKVFPALAGLSFAEIRAKSRLPRYNAEAGDLDILLSLFVSSVYKTFPNLGAEFLPVLDLVALASLADLMPLENENRILVRLGMQTLNKTRRPGLRALLMRLRLLGRPLSTTDVSWQLTPVLNAAGRMGEPGTAAGLLLSTDEAERKALAERLETLNQQRKQASLAAWDVVLPPARSFYEASGGLLALVRDPAIPRGITGILASRLMNTLGAPALVMTHQGERIVGSLRTNRGFQTRQFLDAFADLFTDYGGHAQAAGFHLPLDRAGEFQARLEAVLPNFSLDAAAEAVLEIDAEVPLEYLKAELIQVVDLLEPYGEGNRPLIFVARGLLVLDLDLMGKSGAAHARLTLDAGAAKWPAIWWNALEFLERHEFGVGDRVDVAFNLGRNFYQGQESLQLTVLDLVKS
ncbi:MAG: single-stranded-DNA-specific exonuclease RecJ, partial [Spirochaetales bacterium]|nr:single-stranded-DNA-specific exonuclease RecJ [Spirochaetales bacterium]